MADHACALRVRGALSDDVRDNAIEVLQSSEPLGLWTKNRDDYPSPPGLPSFNTIRPEEATYDSILILAKHCKDGKLQQMRRARAGRPSPGGTYLARRSPTTAMKHYKVSGPTQTAERLDGFRRQETAED